MATPLYCAFPSKGHVCKLLSCPLSVPSLQLPQSWSLAAGALSTAKGMRFIKLTSTPVEMHVKPSHFTQICTCFSQSSSVWVVFASDGAGAAPWHLSIYYNNNYNGIPSRPSRCFLEKPAGQPDRLIHPPAPTPPRHRSESWAALCKQWSKVCRAPPAHFTALPPSLTLTAPTG